MILGAHDQTTTGMSGHLDTQRFTLDFMPVLFVLVALGLRDEAEQGRAALWRGAIVYAALLNALVISVLPALAGAFHALER